MFFAIPREQVLAEIEGLAQHLRHRHPEIAHVGLFGSYAAGRHVPGSDADLLLLLHSSSQPCWFRRSLGFDTSSLSVPADVFAYTLEEAARRATGDSWFRHICRRAIWFGPEPRGGYFDVIVKNPSQSSGGGNSR